MLSLGLLVSWIALGLVVGILIGQFMDEPDDSCDNLRE